MKQQRELPKDPIVRDLVLKARRQQLTRRTLLAGTGGAAALAALAACSTDSEEPNGNTGLTPAEDLSDTQKTITWANWTLYLDEDDDANHPSLDQFVEKTGISVDYKEDIDGNNTFFAKIRDQLLLGQDTGYDTFCLTDWMVSRLVRGGLVQDLNAANIPNKKNLVDDLANPDFDPGRNKSIPWQGGFAGVAWNTEALPQGIKSLEDIWKPELKGKVTVLDELRDTIGLILMAQGVNISSNWGDNEFANAIDYLQQKVADNWVRRITGNSYTEDLERGDAIVSFAWSGDITMMNYELGYDKYAFALPDSGGTLWTDTFSVPMGSPHKKNVETMINHYYEPEVAAEVALWVNYITPVLGAKEFALEMDEEVAENQLIFPSDETLAQAHIFRSLTDEEDSRYNEQFQKIVLGA